MSNSAKKFRPAVLKRLNQLRLLPSANQRNPASKTFSVKLDASIRRKERSVLSWKAYKVNSQSLKSVDEKASTPTSIIGGSDRRSGKEFLEAGKKRLAGDTTRQATAPEVHSMKSENEALKQLVAELSLENRVLKKSLKADE